VPIAHAMCVGPDPADPSRILIRKIVELNQGRWAYETITVTKVEGTKVPVVHSTMTLMEGFDLKELVSLQEQHVRRRFWAMPNLIGFSMYYRKC
jgi:hypothetical protein